MSASDYEQLAQMDKLQALAFYVCQACSYDEDGAYKWVDALERVRLTLEQIGDTDDDALYELGHKERILMRRSPVRPASPAPVPLIVDAAAARVLRTCGGVAGDRQPVHSTGMRHHTFFGLGVGEIYTNQNHPTIFSK